MMSFAPLWETMQSRGLTTYALIEKHGLSRGTLDKLKHNRNVTLETIEKLCIILDCKVEDIVVYIPNK